MKNLQLRSLTLLTGIGFIATIIAGVAFYGRFRDLTVEHSRIASETFTRYIDRLNQDTLGAMARYVEQKFPVLRDRERLRREAGTDWFWDQSRELTLLARSFNIAYIYYIEKTPDGYVFLMSSEIRRDYQAELLGAPVWTGSAPAFIDEAWESGQLTYSPEPTINHWGWLISAELPIIADGNVVGILGVDYDVSTFLEPLRESQLSISGRQSLLLDRMQRVLIAFIAVITVVMCIQMVLDYKTVLVPLRSMEAIERTRVMMDATPIACSIWDENCVMIDCNNESLRVLGLSKKSDYINHFYDLCPEYQQDGTATREKTVEKIRAALASGRERFEWMHRTASGEPLPVEITLVRVPWKDSYRIAAYFHDLREIRAKEQAAFESEERMKAMLDTMSFACYFFNEECEVLDCNQRAVELYGCTDKEMLLENFYNLSPEFQPDGSQSADQAKAHIRRAFHEGKNIFNWEHLRPDRTTLPVEVTLIRIKWKDGNRVVAYARDLSELMDTRENLVRLASIAESSPSIILYLGEEGNIEYLNPAASEISGFSTGELLGGGLRLIFSEKDLQRLNQGYIVAAQQKRVVKFEMNVKTRGGQIRDFSFSAFSTRLPSGKLGVGLLGRDISELKQIQRDLVAANEQTERALTREAFYNKAKTDFLSRVSHEMRTPLNAIIGVTRMAKKSAGKEQEPYFSKIGEASEYLLNMVNDILDMTGIDTGEFVFSSYAFNFEKTTRQIIDAITPKADVKEQRFITEIDPAIPPVLISDERRLRQIFVKLLSNAVQFTPEKGTIRFSARLVEQAEHECAVHFEVGDNGIGIPKEAQERLWEAFEQADNSITREHGGIGLSLSLIKRIVRMMNGDIRVESEPGRGALFVCNLRLGIERSLPERERPAPGTGVFDLSGRRILVVDDVDINRDIVFALLEDSGAAYDGARDGAEAVRMFSQSKYDVVLMDIHMPGMDGLDATRGIRALDLPWAASTPVLSLSADSSAEIQERGRAAGINAHIAKPVDAEVLFGTLAQWLPKTAGSAQGNAD
ncbi:MAG: PAS domain S-box protein [Spirochaetaceae bacterium]|jgi:PAS domain S-box-containing protein|nr:PAS domain S-box protein [Spirochaetaceae bacterium]